MPLTISPAILEFLVNHFLLDLADALHHRLLRRLRGDASKILRRHFHLDRVANVCALFKIARLGQRNFVLRIRDVLDHHHVGERADVARLWINVDAEIARCAHTFFGGREQGVRNRLDQDFAFDPALPLEVIQHCYKLCVHKHI